MRRMFGSWGVSSSSSNSAAPAATTAPAPAPAPQSPPTPPTTTTAVKPSLDSLFDEPPPPRPASSTTVSEDAVAAQEQPAASPSPARPAAPLGGSASTESFTAIAASTSSPFMAPAAAPSERTPSSSIPDLPEIGSLVSTLTSEGRYREALNVLSQRELIMAAHEEKKLLDTSRMIDDELEQAIVHRDAMKLSVAQAADRKALVEFVVAFRWVRSTPMIRVSLDDHGGGGGEAGPTLKALQSKPGGMEKHLKDAAGVQKLRKIIEQAGAASDRTALSQARSESEVLLVATLTQLCRAVITMCCATVIDDSSDLSQTSRSRSPTATFSNSSFMKAIEVRSAWEQRLSDNLVVLRETSAGKVYLHQLKDLLYLARQVVTHRICIEVQATTSPLIAELLSIFDRMGTLPTIDRRPAEFSCPLSGTPLDDQPSAMIHIAEDDGEQGGKPQRYYKPAVVLFQQVCDAPLPVS